jgi:hypothetical protein
MLWFECVLYLLRAQSVICDTDSVEISSVSVISANHEVSFVSVKI